MRYHNVLMMSSTLFSQDRTLVEGVALVSTIKLAHGASAIGLLPDDRPEQAHHDEEPAEEGDEAQTAVRRARADVRDQLEDDPERDRPADEEEREEELRVRSRDAPHPPGAALARQCRPQHDQDHRRHDGHADAERDRLLEGDEEELHLGGDASRWTRPERRPAYDAR